MAFPPGVREAPVVTICIPSYNRAGLVTETLDSIIAQTFPAWETIVVDDGSTDQSSSVIGEYCRMDSRVHFLERGREPKGACTCRNIAVDAAKGSYVMFLDTDDILAPFCLEQRVRVMEENADIDFAIFASWIFHKHVQDASRLWSVETGEDDLVRLLRMDPVCQGTGTLWKRKSFESLGKWHEGLGIWQDIELHLRAFTSGMRFVKRLDLPADVYLRESEASLSRGEYNSRPKLESRAVVARTAVAHLKAAGRCDLVREARFFCSSVFLGAAASRNFDIGSSTLRWARGENVFTRGEILRLRLIGLASVLRLDRLGFVRKLRDRLSGAFRLRAASQTQSSVA